MRLHVFLAQQGIASRRQSEQFIADGKVKVNNKIATVGQAVDPEKDLVKFDGKVVKAKPLEVVTYLVYKPVGIVSTTSDELGRTNVVDYLKQQLPLGTNIPRLYPIGRLDLTSEGLMVLTNDGQLTFRLTHPSSHASKIYHILLDRFPTAKALDHLRKGVKLFEGFTQPAEVEILDPESSDPWISLTIYEGKHHQVKRMLERVGYTVNQLIRFQMGDYSLDQLNKKTYLKI